ncbi:hypothetical protein GCM10017786_48030 [Amycolatopsis deserti]|uniref:Integral membrane protein n=1 Tax=Amycolatopsis deserti TaxID=185696 RepID=A0ABQ3J7I1_9PSEU|nr:hypothetical protein [Amycolatopsis deserti]GHF08624.1 hypothetical protein GCM10017786_48030 [Amycolatopsis deserti]
MTATAQARVAGPRRTLAALRVVTALHAVAVLAQPVLAGEFLAGEIDALDLHELNSMVVSGFGVIQVVVAVVYVWAGHGRFWPLAASAGIALVEQVQSGFGYAGDVAVHIPLGVSVVAVQILLTVWLFRDAAARRRSR